MATKKKVETPAESGDPLEAKVGWLERQVKRLIRSAERHWGVDIDGDGYIGEPPDKKSGSGRLVAFAMSFCLMFGMMVGFGAETVLWNGAAGSGDDAVIQMSGDNMNATNDTLRLVMQNGQSFVIKIGATTVATYSSGGGFTWTGDLTGPNGETIDNASDSNLRITYDDDGGTIINFILESDNNATNMADDDIMNIKYITDDSASNNIVWVTLEAQVKDVTSTTKDSQFEIKTWCNNTQVDALTLDSEAGDTILNFGVDNATLGQLILDTVNNATNLADNDLYEIIGRADDSASNNTDYATIQLRATDVTSTTEDGDIRLQVIDNSAEITALTVSGAGLTLENGEIIDNATTDGDILAIFDDDAATLGQLIFDTSINATNHADDDLYEIVGRGDDSASNATDFAKIQLKFVDVTSTTEDGGIALKYLLAGAEKTINIGVDPSTNQVIAPGADNEIDLGASSLEFKDAYLDGTLYVDAITNSGTMDQVGVATFTGVDVHNGGIDINEDVDIDFDAGDEEVSIETSTNALSAGTGLLDVYAAEDANGDNQQYLLRLRYNNDGGANNEYIICQDNASADAKFTVAEDGNTTIAGTLSAEHVSSTDDADISDDLSVGGDVTVTGNGYTADSTVGAIVAGTCSVVEHGNQAYHKSVFTVTNASFTLADGDDGEGVKIYDFDEGVVAVHGVFVDLTITNSGNFNASTDDLYYVAVGTVEATDADNDLTGTEQNLIAKTTLDTDSGGTTSHNLQTFLDTPDSIDGSSTALDIWLNASVEATDNSSSNVIGWTGTVTVLWSPLGDY